MNIWKDIKLYPPPENKIIMTKIANPDRNIQLLIKQGNLWWVSDKSMYVYYTPTHWQPLPEPPNDNL